MQVADETGTVLNRDSAPDLRIERTILGGPTDLVPLDVKPEHEFQTNFPTSRWRLQWGLDRARSWVAA